MFWNIVSGNYTYQITPTSPWGANELTLGCLVRCWSWCSEYWNDLVATDRLISNLTFRCVLVSVYRVQIRGCTRASAAASVASGLTSLWSLWAAVSVFHVWCSTAMWEPADHCLGSIDSIPHLQLTNSQYSRALTHWGLVTCDTICSEPKASIAEKPTKLRINSLWFSESVKPSSGSQYCWKALASILTHCGLLMPYSIIDLGQHWIR